MEIGFATPSLRERWRLVVGAFEGRRADRAAAEADKATGGALKRALSRDPFYGQARAGRGILAPVRAEGIAHSAGGSGQGCENSIEHAAENVGATVVGKLLTHGETDVVFALDVPKGAKLKTDALAAHLALGAQLRS